MQRAKKGSSKTNGFLKPALLENKPPFFHFFSWFFSCFFLCSLLQELGFQLYIYHMNHGFALRFSATAVGDNLVAIIFVFGAQ